MENKETQKQPSNLKTIKIGDQAYNVDIDKAIQDGYLTKVKRPLTISDIPNGSIFRVNRKDRLKNYTNSWLCLMVDNTRYSSGQCLLISKDDKEARGGIQLSYFANYEDYLHKYYDVNKKEWISEI